MMNEHEYYCFLKEFWKVTNDGFIIVDPKGVIVVSTRRIASFWGKPVNRFWESQSAK